MRIDRIILDIIAWAKTLLWREQQKKKLPTIHKTLTAVDGIPISGLLQLIERDTLRAIRTWRYLPKRNSKGTPTDDILICCDTLAKFPNEHSEDGIDAIKAGRRGGMNTHRITIMRSSHFLNSDGEFDVEILYSDCFSFWQYPNRWAIAATDSIAYLVPFEWERVGWDIDWGREVQRSFITTRGR